MTRNSMRQLGAAVLLVVGLAGCAKCPPSQVTGDRNTCNWGMVPGSTVRHLVCNIGSLRIAVDTTGVGEG